MKDSDLDRWETTLEGPKRLSAVVLYNKYPHDLRLSAAISLIEMKPRKGQRVGIERLVKGTLTCDPAWLERKTNEPCQTANLSPESRDALLKELVPRMIEALRREVPAPVQGGLLAADPSFQYKDAAFMMLTYEATQILTDAGLRQQLHDALRDWALADFERRLGDQTQMFGMEQMLRHIGATSVEGLPGLIAKTSLGNLGKVADLVSRIGTPATNAEAGTQFVKLVDKIGSADWRKEQAPAIAAANDTAGLKPDGKQFEGQLENYQLEVLMRVYGAMKKVGGAAVVDKCLRVAADKGAPLKVRQSALAALEGHIDKKSTKDIERLVAIARASETPLDLVDIAFRHLKQLPREVVAKPLYQIFDTENWKVRRAAGSAILQMSKVEHLDEFMKEFSERATKNFNLPEARTLAAYLGELRPTDPAKPGQPPLARLAPHMKEGKVHARITALAYYLVYGTKKDLPAVNEFIADKTKVPKCDEKADCSWECIVVGADKKEEKKLVETLGEFVTYCVVPKVAQTDEAPKAAAPKDAPPKPEARPAPSAP
ncbi:MAG: hypothetical protein EXR75_04460 [Myxococcales bacterium]|nr:hypothetical protein [Myxococcales bacterium]